MCVLCRFISVYMHSLVSESVMADDDVRCVFLCLSILIFETGALTEPGTCHLSQMGWPASLVSAGPFFLL